MTAHGIAHPDFGIRDAQGERTLSHPSTCLAASTSSDRRMPPASISRSASGQHPSKVFDHSLPCTLFDQESRTPRADLPDIPVGNAMHFSVRDNCRVPLARTPDPSERFVAIRPPLLRGSGFASISKALQQAQHQLPWAQRRAPSTEQAAVAVEPKTGLAFQTEYCQRGRSHCGQLAGVG